MKTDTRERAAVVHTAHGAAPAALAMKELACTPHYDVKTAAGATLWHCITLANLNGVHEPLSYCGGTLGLGDDTIKIYVRTPTRSALISLEQALRHLELFEPETRWRLVVGVEFCFDCKLERGAA